MIKLHYSTLCTWNCTISAFSSGSSERYEVSCEWNWSNVHKNLVEDVLILHIGKVP